FGPSPYLKARDLHGRTIVAVVDSTELREIGFPKRPKLIVPFVGKRKTLPLNKTNAEAFAAIARSRNTDDWRGLRVRLKPTAVKYQGRDVDTVRVLPVSSPAARHDDRDTVGHTNAPASSAAVDHQRDRSG